MSSSVPTASGRGDYRDGGYGNKMTGWRFLTFTRRYLTELLPKVLSEAGDDLVLTFDAAWRDARGRLRGNQ
ncbi:hypothetical protein AAG565_14550 [Fontimonas sp. SYSU GA230001]|uniref:hypothetical protein n=1 Tax=Fontimonas sp. SYSU GA230001 TaxID=3142450 RepID=UPI0032B3A17F